MNNDELKIAPLDEVEEEYGEENSSKAGRLIAGVAGLVIILVVSYYIFTVDLSIRGLEVMLLIGGFGGVLLFLAIFQGIRKRKKNS